MNKQEIFFAGALFFAICAIGQWSGYAPVICVVCALISAILFWRGLTLHIQTCTNENTKQQEDLQRRWDDGQQQLQGQHEALLQTLEGLENSLHAQEERLAACIGSVQATIEMELQCISSIRDHMEPATARIEADMARICEKLDLQHEDHQILQKKWSDTNSSVANRIAEFCKGLNQHFDNTEQALVSQNTYLCNWAERLATDRDKLNSLLLQQHEDNKSDLESIFAIILGMEKVWKELPEMLKKGSEDITQNVDELREKMDRDFKQMISCSKNGWDQLEEFLSNLEEALNKQCKTMEEEGANQRSWMDDLMQKYADVTAQDLEALRLLKEV